MALASMVDSLDEVPEVLREHYVPRKDGKFVLDTEGDSRVSSARRGEERAKLELKAAQDRLKAFEAQGITKPEDIDGLRTRRRKEDDEEETAAQRMQRLRNELDDVKRNTDMSVREKDAALAQVRAELNQERIGTRIRSVAQARVYPWAIEDVVLNGMRTFRQDETGKISAFDGDERLLGKNGEDLTMDEWLDGMRQSRPGWYPEGSNTGNRGGEAQHQNVRQATRARPKSRSEMTPEEASAAITELGSDGYMNLPA